MERLTEKCWRNLDPWECCGQDKYCQRGCHDEGGCTNGCKVPKMYCKLAEYEDAEEQGLLLRLPCKVGDAVWYVEEYDTPEITRGVVDGYLWYRTCGFALNVVWDEPIMAHFAYTRKEMPFSDIGRCVFLTREEAESALAEKGGA